MKYLKGFFIGIVIIVGAQYVSAAWTNPSATPPSNNTDTPINVGLSQQNKLGSLFLNTDTSNPYTIGLGVFGKSVLNGTLQIADGTQHVGYVLVSTDGLGDAAWTSTSSLGITGGSGTGGTGGTNGANGYNGGFRNFKVYDSSGNFTVPSGITTVMAEAWGAGGDYNPSAVNVYGGGGGYGKSIFTVTPGQVIQVTIGAAGTISHSGGGSSSFLGLVSNGGSGGSGGRNVTNTNGKGGSSNGQFTRTGGVPDSYGTAGGGGPGEGGFSGSPSTSASSGEIVVWW